MRSNFVESFIRLLRQQRTRILKKIRGNKSRIIANLKIKEDDVFLVSYPRSGNTWMRFVLGGLINNTDVNFDNMEIYFPDIYRNTNSQLESIKSPRFLKSHEPYDNRYPKVIYIVRDPRDVAISYYYWMLKFKKFKGSFAEFLKLFFRRDAFPYGRWDTHYLNWVKNAQNTKNGMIIIKYEDLVIDAFDNILKILNFIGIDRGDDDIEKILNNNNFSQMKSKETNMSDQNQLFKDTNKKIPFLRKGKINQWKSELDDAQVQTFEKEFGATMSEIGYLE